MTATPHHPEDLHARSVLIGDPAPAATLATVGRVDPNLLQAFERCFNGGWVLRFAYTDREGRRTRRRVEPHALLVRAPIWYIVAWDLRRDAPRTFRMDRIRSPVVDEATFGPRPLAHFDALSGGARPLRGSPSAPPADSRGSEGVLD